MPEGPSIVILREEAQRFAGHAIAAASGSAAIDHARLRGQTVVRLRSWGKQLLVEFATFSLRIHLLLFGSYRIDERRATPSRLRLEFDNGELNFYGCSIRILEQPLDDVYDWSADILSDRWNRAQALAKLRAKPRQLACDAVLDQNVFAGAGNIFKNEVLFRIRVHPLSQVGALPARKLRQLVDDVRAYAFEFLRWKKAGQLQRHWLAHRQVQCPRCRIPFVQSRLGSGRRPSYFCERCQKRYPATAETGRSTGRVARKNSAGRAKK